MNKRIYIKISNLYIIFKLILNEFIKTGVYKLLLSCILFLSIILLIYNYSKSNIIDSSYTLLPFVSLLMIILYGGSISHESEVGTIKYYLTKPILRWKIYLSKLLTIFLYLLVVLLYILFIYMILNKGFDKVFFIKYIKYTIPVFLMGTITLFVSTIFRSTALCVGIDLFLLTFSSMISQLLFGIEFNIIEYTFLPYLDFSIFNDMNNILLMNSEFNLHLSLSNAIKIDLIFILIFYYIGNTIFVNKDIKN